MKIKKILCVCLAAALFCLLPACASKARYVSDASPNELAEKLEQVLSNTSYLAAEHEYLENFADPTRYRNGCIYHAANGSNLNEFGIWRTETEEESEALEDALEEHLEESYQRNCSFYDSYIPAETPKLRDAEVRRYGVYVAYAVLSAEERQLFFRELSHLLENG